MTYLIIKHTTYENIEDYIRIEDQTNNVDKANDMLQGYQLIEKDKDVSYSIVKYEQPLILEREVA
jgi:hypothetical protein|tara:strand:+ start:376 stop:570 length:195 start_codon:yes stop_codon:yes gene_type:complete